MNIHRIAIAVAPFITLVGIGCSSQNELPIEGHGQNPVGSVFDKGNVSNPLKIQGTGKTKIQRTSYATTRPTK